MINRMARLPWRAAQFNVDSMTENYTRFDRFPVERERLSRVTERGDGAVVTHVLTWYGTTLWGTCYVMTVTVWATGK